MVVLHELCKRAAFDLPLTLFRRSVSLFMNVRFSGGFLGAPLALLYLEFTGGKRRQKTLKDLGRGNIALLIGEVS